ncbi:MAG: hypothetical protein RJA44_780 [Pseudomonadota bacterium]
MNNYDLLSLGASALYAAQAQLQTTGHNIANASVEGYSRQSALLSTVAGKYTGSGYMGGGVRVDTVTRAVNSFLTSALGQSSAAASADKTRNDMVQRLQASFSTGENGLGYATTQLFNAWSDLASNPGDNSSRQVVLARAEDLAAMFRDTGQRLDNLQSEVHDEVVQSVSSVNIMARQVAELNLQIVGAKVRAQNPNDLLDQRDQLVKKISDQIHVSSVEQADGMVNLYVGVGQALVLGAHSNLLSASASNGDISATSVSINVAGQDRQMGSDTIGGGALSGLLRFQDQDLAAGRSQLDLMATSVAMQINAQQALGVTQRGLAGEAMFKLPAPSVSADRTNVTPASSISMTIQDPTQLKATRYELRADPLNPGQFMLTDLTTGQVTKGISDGSVLDGFVLRIGNPPPAAGDRFLLAPVGGAALGIQRVLTLPQDLAAATPATVSAASTNTGTAQVSSFGFVSPNTMPSSPLQLSFTTAAGHYQITNAAGTTLQQGDWVAGQPIKAYGFELQLSGVPKVGDQFALSTTIDPSSSNGNALSMAALATKATTVGSAFSDYFAATLADVGLRAQQAESASTASASVAQQVQRDLASQTGVNLDEEAARLIQFQQSYQAAAKVMQSAQKVFDTLLSLAN